jgi:hypothetical protein
LRHLCFRLFGLALVTMFATGDANAAAVVLVNESGVVLEKLYISPCSAPHWGANQLAGAPLESSRSFTVSDLPPGCYDLKVVLPPWNSCVLNGAAVFKSLVWRITWSTAIESTMEDCSRTAHIVSVGRLPWIPPGGGR